MTLLKLAWSYLKARPLGMLLGITLLALGVGTTGVVMIVSEQFGSAPERTSFLHSSALPATSKVGSLVHSILTTTMLAVAGKPVLRRATPTSLRSLDDPKRAMTFTATAAVTAPNISQTPTPPPNANESEAADKLERQKIRAQIEANLSLANQCVTRKRGCTPTVFPSLLLGLTRPEVDALLGPMQYRLRLSGKEYYYWTIVLKTGDTTTPIRVRVEFGDCYHRERSSRKKAVCQAELF